MPADNRNTPRLPSVADAKSIRIGDETAPPQGDTGPETRPPDEETIAKLAAMNPLEYDRVRAGHAKRMGCRPATLDKLVHAARKDNGEASDLPFPAVEPWPERVDPATLLNFIVAVILRFIVMGREQAVAATLWVASTWFTDVLDVAPLAAINAPEKACAKSLLLEVIGHISRRSLPVSNVSTAALFRSVELWGPTLLIDEADVHPW